MTEFGEKAPAFLPCWQNVVGLFYGVVFFSTGAAATEPNYRGLSFLPGARSHAPPYLQFPNPACLLPVWLSPLPSYWR